jgi:hypothetical protein
MDIASWRALTTQKTITEASQMYVLFSRSTWFSPVEGTTLENTPTHFSRSLTTRSATHLAKVCKVLNIPEYT